MSHDFSWCLTDTYFFLYFMVILPLINLLANILMYKIPPNIRLLTYQWLLELELMAMEPDEKIFELKILNDVSEYLNQNILLKIIKRIRRERRFYWWAQE